MSATYAFGLGERVEFRLEGRHDADVEIVTVRTIREGEYRYQVEMQRGGRVNARESELTAIQHVSDASGTTEPDTNTMSKL